MGTEKPITHLHFAMADYEAIKASVDDPNVAATLTVAATLHRVGHLLDDLGMNNRNPEGGPGTTEKIAMELEELKTVVRRMANTR